jgi:coatomer protein complex subunit alpha (xenin)
MPPFINYVRRTVTETDSRKILPLIPRDLESVQAAEMTAGKNAMKSNKLEDGVVAFKKVLLLLMVNAISSQSQVQEAQSAIQLAAQYVLAMSIELERRKLVQKETDLSSFSDDIKKRSLELSAYFTVPGMEPQHQTLALFSAMNLANKNKQLGSALGFANALIERGTNAKFKENVNQDQIHMSYTRNANQSTGKKDQSGLRTLAQ